MSTGIVGFNQSMDELDVLSIFGSNHGRRKSLENRSSYDPFTLLTCARLAIERS